MAAVAPTVLFDIDYTIVDGHRLRALLIRHLFHKIITLSSFIPDIKAAGYLLLGTPREFLTSGDAERSFLNPEYYKESIFPDVRPALKQLDGRVRLGIFSQGFYRLQHAKIALAGLERFFDLEIFFALPPNKKFRIKEVFEKLPKGKIYFVDDRPNVVVPLSRLGVKGFLIDRRGRKRVSKGIRRIASLTELSEIIGS